MTTNNYTLRLASALLVCLLNITEAVSQVAKGSVRLGTEIAYSGTTQAIDNSFPLMKTSTYGILISGGYYAIDNLEIGLGVQLQRITNETSYTK